MERTWFIPDMRMIVPPSADQPVPGATGIVLHTDDVEATRAWLADHGHDVDAAVARDGADVEISIGAVRSSSPFPPMFWLRDPDGNGLLVIQP